MTTSTRESPLSASTLMLVTGLIVLTVACTSDKEGGSSATIAVTASMDVLFPDGFSTSVELPSGTLGGRMEFDPDDRPEMRRLEMDFSSSANPSIDCGFEVFVSGYCGPGVYPLGASAGASATLFDCPEVPDSYEVEFGLNSGSVTLYELSVDAASGAAAGDFYPVAVGGVLENTLDGLTVISEFQISGPVLGRDAEERECGEYTPLDPDGSGLGDDDSLSGHVVAGRVSCAAAPDTGEEYITAVLDLETDEPPDTLTFEAVAVTGSFYGLCMESEPECNGTARVSDAGVRSCEEASGLAWTGRLYSTDGRILEEYELSWTD